MICQYCGKEIQRGQTFCPRCGTSVEDSIAKREAAKQEATNREQFEVSAEKSPYDYPAEPPKGLSRKVKILFGILITVVALVIAFFAFQAIKNKVENNMSTNAEEAFLSEIYSSHYMEFGDALEKVARERDFDLNIYTYSHLFDDVSTITVHISSDWNSTADKKCVSYEYSSIYEIPSNIWFYDINIDFEYNRKKNAVEETQYYYGYAWFYTQDEYGMITIKTPEVRDYFVELIYQAAEN